MRLRMAYVLRPSGSIAPLPPISRRHELASISVFDSLEVAGLSVGKFRA